ncbi:hypothetical protein GCM10009606_22670 [Nocardioides aquiterrae]|uniref:Uncharacterized protein n=1 Tax=Nocardioides aquiterrae TaxID=203799 RepID=A0ABP4F1P5_9ACTN
MYLPTTLALLAEQHAEGVVVVPEDVVVAEDDSEDAEYAALMTAADASTALLGGPGRRVVVVAELDQEPAPGGAVPLRRVAAVHADVADRPAGADPDEDLGWFATQEIPDLLR